MNLFKILNARIIFYLLLIVTIFMYFLFTGVNSKNEVDFLISMGAVIILGVATLAEIRGKRSQND